VGVSRSGASTAAPTPALVVPDEAAWAVWGHDIAADGLEPVAEPERALVMVLPERVPEPLAPALREAHDRALSNPRIRLLPAPMSGRPAREVLAAGHGADARHDREGHHHEEAHDHGSRRQEPHDHEAHDHERHDEPGGARGGHDHATHGHAGHGHDAHEDEHAAHGHDRQEHEHAADDDDDHHDMMAIVGDASRDGLVMESIDFELGPLSASLPGGLVVDLSLDGDVVASAHAHATLETPAEAVASGAPADPLAPIAWMLAVDTATNKEPPQCPAALELAALEVERAVSHSAWLGTIGRVAGWPLLRDRARLAVRAAVALRASVVRALNGGAEPPSPATFAEAHAAAATLRAAVERGRPLRRRLRGRAVVSTSTLRAAHASGPVPRAAGLAVDARAGDPAYAALGFEPEVEDTGDAEARVLVRARELTAALALARRALEAGDLGGPGTAEAPVAVESPRGEVRAARDGASIRVSAPGAGGLAALAGEAIRGLELGTALLALASFDLSPWRVPG
jgi:NADH:ubiquinone oxidoreductase subunit D